MNMPLQIAVLAAGKGKRMHFRAAQGPASARREALARAPACDRRAMNPRAICVVEGAADAVRKRFPDPDLIWARQDPPRGTGDALRCALAALRPTA
jgi:bifunctional N-acetylglucosamine-1-phosphate-uridyltransferase/glucosamine-1-phosphate-acetyltransferase GlmU-like protein